MEYGSKPRSRTDKLVVQDVDGEVLIYDLSNDKAFCLNSTSAAIWKLCDGEHSVVEIADQIRKELRAKDSEDLVWLALDQLKKENLISGLSGDRDPFGGLSRRQVIKKIGLASMVAIPVVSSLIAPAPVHAASICRTNNHKTCFCPAPSCTSTGGPAPSSTCAGTAFFGFTRCTSTSAGCLCRGPFTCGPLIGGFKGGTCS